MHLFYAPNANMNFRKRYERTDNIRDDDSDVGRACISLDDMIDRALIVMKDLRFSRVYKLKSKFHKL